MTPEQIFQVANLVALAGWLLLAILPGRRWVATAVTSVAIPGLLAVVYIVALAPHWSDAEGGFGSLPQVAQLFENRWLLLAGWVHYLCFDLLIGTWEVQDAQARGVPHLLVVPCLILTFLFGPAGWLLYKGFASVHSRSKA